MTGVFQELFPTVLGFYELDVDNDSLYTSVKDLESTHDGRYLDELIFQSKGNLHHHKDFLDLNQKVQNCAIDYLKNHHYKFSEQDVFLSNCWANLSRNYACTHRAHIHRNTLISAVYFINAPKGCGKLYFPHPNVTGEMLRADDDNLHPYNWMEYVVDPKPGLCVVFKSSTLHGVEQNKFENSKDERLSLGYTFNLKNIGRYSDYAKST